jgi:hypothetical protein
MNIGFFGHSTVGDDTSGKEGSFIIDVAKHFNAQIVNVGTGQGSEERILFELKKCKERIDVAVIFHSRAQSLFLPGCRMDFNISEEPDRKAEIIWAQELIIQMTPPTENEDQLYAEKYKESLQYRKNFSSVFKTQQDFIICMRNFKKYLYHQDLQQNRFEGALLLVDQYCAARVPRVVHSINPTRLPPWWAGFKSGVLGDELFKIEQQYRQVGLPNCLTPEGHQKMGVEVIRLITDQLSKK